MLTISDVRHTDQGQVYVAVLDGTTRVAFFYGASEDEAKKMARTFVAAADAIDAVMTMDQYINLHVDFADNQWEFMEEKVRAVVKLVKEE